MELLTTYTVIHKKINLYWVFKYCLNGHLRSFIIEDKELTQRQIVFLFGDRNFPYNENQMKEVWLKAKKSEFEITVGEPDLSFETFYEAYRHPVKKIQAKAKWEKLSKKDKIEALKGIKPYDGYLSRKGVAKANPAAYLNQRYWEDDHNAIH